MADQQCPSINDTFREYSLAEVYHHGVMLMVYGDPDRYDDELLGFQDAPAPYEQEVCHE